MMGEHRMDARLLDAMFSSYADWWNAAQHVQIAYREWRRAAREEAASAFAGYTAALDREERASEAYAGHVERASRFVARHLPVAAASGS
jgi:hypothetical protein